MIVKLLTEHHLEFLSLKGGCTGSSESTLVKMPHCRKSHVTAQMRITIILHINKRINLKSAPHSSFQTFLSKSARFLKIVVILLTAKSSKTLLESLCC